MQGRLNTMNARFGGGCNIFQGVAKTLGGWVLAKDSWQYHQESGHYHQNDPNYPKNPLFHYYHHP